MKIEPKGFADGLVIGFERVESKMIDHKIFWLEQLEEWSCLDRQMEF